MRLLILIGCLLPGLLWAQPNIHVVGLFKNKALVMVDGKRKLMRVGETFRDVHLDYADSREAMLSYNGVSQSFTLSNGGGFAPTRTSKASYTITPSFGGTYKTHGSINGQVMDFIVDTGASMVSLNSDAAKQLGLDYKSGKEVSVLTASSKVAGYMVTLDQITLGSIRLEDVEATVLEGEHPSIVLLGMSFLKHLKVVNENGRMQLIQK